MEVTGLVKLSTTEILIIQTNPSHSFGGLYVLVLGQYYASLDMKILSTQNTPIYVISK